MLNIYNKTFRIVNNTEPKPDMHVQDNDLLVFPKINK